MQEKEIVSAYLLTEESSLPQLNLMMDVFEQYWPKHPKIKSLKQNEKQISFKFENCIGYITLNDEQLQADNLTVEHNCFLGFSLVGDNLNPLEKSLYLSQIMFAAIQATPSSIGVYWENAFLYHPKVKFEKVVSECGDETLPIQLWVNFQFYKHPDERMSLLTNGLKAFSLKEIEVHQSQRAPELVLETVFEATYYMIIHGNNFEDGEAVKRNDAGVIRAHYAPSLADKNQEVITLVIVQ